MSAHQVLAAVRNSVATEGWDVHTYGRYEGCGTPRCMLGWLGFHTGIGVTDSLFEPPFPPAYAAALEALWQARPPVDGELAPYELERSLPDRVEELAFVVTATNSTKGREGKRAAILAWLDDAVALTAPVPDLSFLDDRTEVVA